MKSKKRKPWKVHWPFFCLASSSWSSSSSFSSSCVHREQVFLAATKYYWRRWKKRKVCKNEKRWKWWRESNEGKKKVITFFFIFSLSLSLSNQIVCNKFITLSVKRKENKGKKGKVKQLETLILWVIVKAIIMRITLVLHFSRAKPQSVGLASSGVIGLLTQT